MSGPQPLATVIPTLTTKALGKKRAALGGLLAHWDSIVGEALCRVCVPEKLTVSKGLEGAVLSVRVGGAAAIMVQHDTPLILERINAFFGYRAVTRLKLIQAPLLNRAPVPFRPPVPSAAVVERVNALTQNVADEPLRLALQKLGQAIAAKKEKR